jgi:hypothetical protein
MISLADCETNNTILSVQLLEHKLDGDGFVGLLIGSISWFVQGRLLR